MARLFLSVAGLVLVNAFYPPQSLDTTELGRFSQDIFTAAGSTSGRALQGDMNKLMTCVGVDCTAAGMAMMEMQKLQNPEVQANPTEVARILTDMCGKITAAYECMEAAESCEQLLPFVKCMCGFVEEKSCNNALLPLMAMLNPAGGPVKQPNATAAVDVSCTLLGCLAGNSHCTGMLKPFLGGLDPKELFNNMTTCMCTDCKDSNIQMMQLAQYQKEIEGCSEKEKTAPCSERSSTCTANWKDGLNCLNCKDGDTCVGYFLEVAYGTGASNVLKDEKERTCFVDAAGECKEPEPAGGASGADSLRFPAALLALLAFYLM